MIGKGDKIICFKITILESPKCRKFPTQLLKFPCAFWVDGGNRDEILEALRRHLELTDWALLIEQNRYLTAPPNISEKESQVY